MDESKSAESIVPNGTLRRRGRWRVATVVVAVVAALAAVGYAYDLTMGFPGFYLSIPSMTRAEFLEIERKAHEGDATSQLYYGVFYANGDGVWQDYVEAAKWYQKAAELGNVRAQRNLGVLYDYGLGVEINHKEAARWYLQAARQYDAAAHVGIAGLMFANRISAFPEDYPWPVEGFTYKSTSKISSDHIPFGNYKTWLLRAHVLIGSKSVEMLDDDLFWTRYERLDRFSQKQNLVLRAVAKRAENDDAVSQMGMAVLTLGSKVAPGYYIPFNPNPDRIHWAKGNRLLFPSMRDDALHDWLLKAAKNGSHHAQFVLSTVTYHSDYNRNDRAQPLITEGTMIPYYMDDKSDTSQAFSQPGRIYISADSPPEERMEWLRQASHCPDEPFFTYVYLTYLRDSQNEGKTISEFGRDYASVIALLAESGYGPAIREYLKLFRENSGTPTYRALASKAIHSGDIETIVNTISSLLPIFDKPGINEPIILLYQLIRQNTPETLYDILLGYFFRCSSIPHIKKIVTTIENQANSGDIDAQLAMGYWDLAKYNETPSAWYGMAASRGDPHAMHQIGAMAWILYDKYEGDLIEDGILDASVIEATPRQIIRTGVKENGISFSTARNNGLRALWAAADKGYPSSVLFLAYFSVNPKYAHMLIDKSAFGKWRDKAILDNSLCEAHHPDALLFYMHVILERGE